MVRKKKEEPTKVTCPYCKAKFIAPRLGPGRLVTCPRCNRLIYDVPLSAGYVWSATPTVAASTTGGNFITTTIPVSPSKHWTSKVGRRGEVVVPKAVRQALGVKPGDLLDFQVRRSE